MWYDCVGDSHLLSGQKEGLIHREEFMSGIVKSHGGGIMYPRGESSTTVVLPNGHLVKPL